MTDEHKEKKFHGTPITNALFNLIILGSPYLSLRQYKRFFILYGLILLRLLTFGFSVLPEGIVNIFFFAAYVFVIVDTYILTKKMNEGEIQFPIKNKKLLYTATAIIISIIAIPILVLLFLPPTEYGQSPFENFLEEREKNSRRKEITKNNAPIRSEHCDSFKNNDRYIVDNFHANTYFTEYCYSKIAVETKNPLNCAGFHESLGLNDDCLGYIAYLNSNPNLCAELSFHEAICDRVYQLGEPPEYPCEISRMPESLKEICVEELGGAI